MYAAPSHPRDRDGDESIRDAVLRMLVDKYKPLRTGTIKTADEKIKDLTPRLMTPLTASLTPIATLSAPVNEDTSHKPWLVTFKVPSHATITPAITFGRIPPSPLPSSPISAGPDDAKARAEARKLKKREAGARRLTKARESTLDYRMGGSLVAVETARAVRRNPGSEDVEEPDTPQPSRRLQANPHSLRGWSNLIEDKIEVYLLNLEYTRSVFIIWVYSVLEQKANFRISVDVENPWRETPAMRILSSLVKNS